MSSRSRIAKDLELFESKRIVIPERMLRIADAAVSEEQVPTGQLLVRYFPEEDCTDCILKHLSDYSYLFDLSESRGDFYPLIAFSMCQDEIGGFIKSLEKYGFHFPVWIDEFGAIEALNDIPSDKRFHCFLLNLSNKPIFVGDPMSSNNMMSLFIKSLDSQ